MKNKVILILFLVGFLLTAVIAYNALFVVHYDLDPVSVLASLLNIPIPVLGYISGAISLILLYFGITRFRATESA